MTQVNDNGVVDLYRFIIEVSHGKDVENAQQGVGMMGMLGTVVKGTPDVQIMMQGVTTLVADDVILSSANYDLMIPDGMRLTPGDTVGLVPFRAEKIRWWVMGITRDPVVQPLQNARFGYNGDRNSGDPTASFAGVLVAVPDGENGSSSVVTVQGANVRITSFGGASVTIDGINFKTHTHTDPQGGNTGPPH